MNPETAPDTLDPERPLDLFEKNVVQVALMERAAQDPEDWIALHGDAFRELLNSRLDLRAKLRADFNAALDEIEQILNRPSRLPHAA